jgi:hypothetical protein
MNIRSHERGKLKDSQSEHSTSGNSALSASHAWSGARQLCLCAGPKRPLIPRPCKEAARCQLCMHVFLSSRDNWSSHLQHVNVTLASPSSVPSHQATKELMHSFLCAFFLCHLAWYQPAVFLFTGSAQPSTNTLCPSALPVSLSQQSELWPLLEAVGMLLPR